MRRIIRRKASGLILGGLLLVAGLAALLWVFWKASTGVSAGSGFDVLWSYIINEQMSFGSFVTFKLIYLTVMGTVFLGLGLVVLGFSRQIFYLSGESAVLRCPYCKNTWKARRAVGWAECPHCRQFVQPVVMRPGA